jgi:alpha-N-arabinofuranosidase
MAGKKPVNPFTGNFTFRDDFDDNALNVRYTFLRTVTDQWYSTSDKKGQLRVLLRPQTVSGSANPSFVGFRQQHHKGSAAVKLQFAPGAANEKAGLVIFQNESHFYYLCKSMEGKTPVVQLYKSTKDSMELIVSRKLPATSSDVYLRIEPNNAVYKTSFSTNGKNWTGLQEVDGKFLSTATAGGFVGCVFGLYATSLGKESANKAYYDWFEYKGNDDVFN